VREPRPNLSRVWSVHESNLPGDLGPFHLPLDSGAAVPILLQLLLPSQKLVCEEQVRLNDDVEAASAHKAIRTW
jgi:hypothetical protein